MGQPHPRIAEITRLLSLPKADRVDADELFPLVYNQLRTLARARLSRLKPGQTVSATDLVHEVWLKVVAGGDPGWEGRAHFFGAASNAMREILVDQARRRFAKKRDAMRREVMPTEVAEAGAALPNTDVLSVHEALSQFEREHPRPAKVVLMRFFGGLAMQEIAAALDVSVPTVERDWRFARAALSELMDNSDRKDDE